MNMESSCSSGADRSEDEEDFEGTNEMGGKSSSVEVPIIFKAIPDPESSFCTGTRGAVILATTGAGAALFSVEVTGFDVGATVELLVLVLVLVGAGKSKVGSLGGAVCTLAYAAFPLPDCLCCG